VAKLEDGSLIRGEHAIGMTKKRIRRLALDPPDVPALPACLKALREADAIIVGPGSLYTSLLAPMLVRGMIEAIRESRGIKVLVGNLMTQSGETTGFTGRDHLKVIEDHLGGRLFEAVVINRAVIPDAVRARYVHEGAEAVEWDEASVVDHGGIPVTGDLLAKDEKVRHDPQKLGTLLAKVPTEITRTKDCQEGMRAFKEKRQPRYTYPYDAGWPFPAANSKQKKKK
jgi:uncharacterized cofD-like protein